ncbi:MAG: type II secretion system protein GspJ [Opitutaceae bacterium]
MRTLLQFSPVASIRPLVRPGEAGFTLIELILAMAVGAIVLIVINSTFTGALRLHNATHRKIDEDLVVQRALGIIRKDLAGIMVPANPQATTYNLSGQLTTETYSTNELDTTSERVTPDIYTSSGAIDGWTPFAEVQMVSYYLSPSEDGGSGKNLVRLTTRNLLPAVDATAEAQTLLTGVVSAGLSYYDGQNWLDTWDSVTTSSLPTAIKFSIVRATGEGSASRAEVDPIEIVVPVLVKTSATLQQEATETAQL